MAALEVQVDLRKNEYVRHPKKPEWGVGRVVSVDSEGVLRISFAKGGVRDIAVKRFSVSLTNLGLNPEALIQYHRDLIEAKGIPYKGTTKSTRQRMHRVTHCYNCKGPLDNSIDIECAQCGWIICGCGACNCKSGA